MNLYYNYNTSKNKNQACIKNISQVVPNLPYQPGIISFTKSDYAILNHFYFISELHPGNLFPSQTRMSKVLGFTRETINRRISILCEKQILFKSTKYIGPNKSFTIYKLSPLILNGQIKSLFSWTFDIFKQICLFWALGNQSQIEITQQKTQNVTLYNVYNLLKQSQSYNQSNNLNTSLGKYKNKLSIPFEVTNRKEIEMNEANNLNLPLSNAMKLAISQLSLSQHGIVSLFLFDDKAILHALSNIKSTKNGIANENKFKIFCSLAHKWHVENKVLRNYNQLNELTTIYPIPLGSKMTINKPVSRNENMIETDFKIKNVNKINYPEPLPGLPEETKSRIQARRNGTYIPKVETREEAAANINRYLKSPDGIQTQNILGILTNPFVDTIQITKKESNHSKPMMENIKGIFNSLNSIQVQPQDNFQPNIKEEYSDADIWF